MEAPAGGSGVLAVRRGKTCPYAERDVRYLPREAMRALEAVHPEGPGVEEVPPTAIAPLVLSVRPPRLLRAQASLAGRAFACRSRNTTACDEPAELYLRVSMVKGMLYWKIIV